MAEALLLVLLLTGCAARSGKSSDDATTTTRVKIALLNDARVGGLRLDVKTFQGVVTLSGTVRSKADEQAAIAAARTIQGVRDVKSELKIQADGIRERAIASEPRERSAPAKRRARERVGESEGRSPSDENVASSLE
jgi:hypothetical protein